MDNSVTLRRNADDIANALHAGERWRADLRSAAGPVRWEDTADGRILHLAGAHGEVAYRFSAGAILRRRDSGPWSSLLTSVKASTMEADPRQKVTAWRWELELQTRIKGAAKPGRFRPLFTFVAVPESSP